MAREVTVAAKATFHYDGREIRPGERVTMRPLEAAAAARLGYVTLTRPRGGLPPATRARDEAAPEPEKRRRYRRRDLEPDA
jgi:hypothetical protein